MQVYSNDGGNWISAAQIIAQSDAMHKKLQPYGFKYINIDAAWNGGTEATTVATTPGASYKGLALATKGNASFLYAANFASGASNSSA